MELSAQDEDTIIQMVRETILEKLTNRHFPPVHTPASLDAHGGVFVTLHKMGNLRGCIGYMEREAPLKLTIRDAANQAAFRDPRFPPVQISELEDIDIEVSLLSPLSEVQDPGSIQVGRHGIYLVSNRGSGVLLPQVATENNWTRDEFLAQTCRKAGLPKSAWRDADVHIFIFSAVIIQEKKKNSLEK